MGVACSKSAGEPAPDIYNPTPTPFVKPINFPAPAYDFTANPLTVEGFELGRKLFYDGRLSKDGSISCGSCHKQAAGFSDERTFSIGVDNKVGTRNSTTIINMAWSNSFFWDGREAHLDEQPIHPIQNPLEMNETIPNVINKLKQDPEYKKLFKKAFGSEEITQVNMLKALSQFMIQCTSSNSKYDSVQRSQGATFTTEEQAGRTLFKQLCAPCHSGELFTDNKFHTNGIKPGVYNDSGRYLITKNINDVYFFKTPSLRNVMQSAPYMHDGRFKTISEVLDHYVTTGIGLHTNEKAKITAFLNTLTDKTFLNNPKLAKQQ